MVLKGVFCIHDHSISLSVPFKFPSYGRISDMLVDFIILIMLWVVQKEPGMF